MAGTTFVPELLLAALGAVLLVGPLACGDDDAGPGGPTVDLRSLTIVLSIVRGIEILDGEAIVAGYGGSHRFAWDRRAASASTSVSVVADRVGTWQFDLEGRLFVDPDTTGSGLLYTHSRTVAVDQIGDTLGVRLELVVPRLEAEERRNGVRLLWTMDVPRAARYELLSKRAGHPDSIFRTSATDTTLLGSSLPEARRVQVRAVLRDDRVSAYSWPVHLPAWPGRPETAGRLEGSSP